MANVRRLLRRALRQRDGEASTGELNIVPFLDIVTNVVMFLLATTASVMTVSEVRADLPGYGPGHARTLALSVTLTDRGAVMATSDGGVDASCHVGGPARVTAARTADGYDLETIGRCAAALHAANPHEDSVVLSADPAVPYRDLVGAMDALRSQGDRSLFPDLQISAGVR